ncbi:MAG: hypothetical protein ACREKH_11360, partial [Candidatus Rokuibacteriota bacterium]
MSDPKAVPESPRRTFLRGAALAATGAATLGFPNVVKAQGPISMRWQSTWPQKDIFHEYANDFAKKVNDMTGGDLKIEVLPAGAVVRAFGLLDAVSKGTLDGGHGVLVYHYGKQTALAGAAALTFPNVVKAQGPISMRWQSTWPAKDIFHEYANDFAKKVNDMTGGDLKIEVLPAGAVVPAFGLLDAVSKGTLDGGHGVLVYHYGKQTALALWGSGPGYGMDANMLLAWHKYGGGKQLLDKLYKSINANVVSFPYGPMPTQPLG